MFKLIRHIRETSDLTPQLLKGASKESKKARESKMGQELEEDNEQEEDYDWDEEEEDGNEGDDGDEKAEEEVDHDIPACARAPKKAKVPEPKKSTKVLDEPSLPTPCGRLQRKTAIQESDVLYIRSTKTAERDELDRTLRLIEELRMRPF